MLSAAGKSQYPEHTCLALVILGSRYLQLAQTQKNIRNVCMVKTAVTRCAERTPNHLDSNHADLLGKHWHYQAAKRADAGRQRHTWANIRSSQPVPSEPAAAADS